VTAKNLQWRLAEESPSTETETPVATQEQEPRQPEPARRHRLGEDDPGKTPSEWPETPGSQIETETLMASLRAEQSLGLAIVGGLAAAVVGAAMWAVVTLATGLQIGWMAVGVGFLVGGAVRLIGKGMAKPFGYLGATLSLLGCLLGNLLSLCAIVGQQEGMSLSLVLLNLDPMAIPGAMVATFQPMDVLFYGIAVYEGYRFSLRRVTSADVARITTELLVI